MCGRYALYADPETLVARFELPQTPDLRPRYNIAPSQEVPAIRRSPEGRRELTLLRWGLVPYWAANETTGHSLIKCPRRDRGDQARVPERLPPAPLSHPRGRVL
jgi:putative SOS response-associated peptidase YedK